jgi:hypothetical protein
LALVKLTQDFPNRLVVALDRCNSLSVSKHLLELRRIYDVGEQQSQQPDAMLALKLFNLSAALDRDLL